jgi:rubrerythrin
MRDSFIFYRSFIQAIEDQPPDNFKKIIMATASYAMDGINPEVMDGTLKMAFNFMKPVIDSNNKKWEATRIARAVSGKKGGLAKQANARNKAKQNLANQAVDVDESVDVDVNVDDQADDSKATQQTTTNSQYIQEIAKSQGFFISSKQARAFFCLEPNWLIGEHNFLVFATEKIKADTSKAQGDHERIFAKSWSYPNLLQEYPAWLEKKQAEAIAHEESREKEKAKQERQRLLSDLKNNGHKTCTHCDFTFENIAVRGSCPSCGWDYFLDEDKVAIVFMESLNLREAYENMLRDRHDNTSEIPSDDNIEF